MSVRTKAPKVKPARGTINMAIRLTRDQLIECTSDYICNAQADDSRNMITQIVDAYCDDGSDLLDVVDAFSSVAQRMIDSNLMNASSEVAYIESLLDLGAGILVKNNLIGQHAVWLVDGDGQAEALIGEAAASHECFLMYMARVGDDMEFRTTPYDALYKKTIQA